MPLPHPLAWLPREHEKAALVILFVLFAAISWCLQSVGRPLQTDVAPMGIVSFEFVGSEAMARQTLYSWRESGTIRAAFVQGLDYAYLLVYALFLALVARVAFRRIAASHPSLAGFGPWVAWGFVGAACADVIENTALVAILFGTRGELAPTVALWMATLKFSLIGAGLLAVLAAIGAGAVGSRR